MTESEWLECTEPQKMLEFLRGKASERKLRLFAVACCRRVWSQLDDERSRQAVEELERYVDGRATEQELKDAHESAWKAWGMPARTAASDASVVDGKAFHPDHVASHAAWATSGRSRAGECQAQAHLLRCIFGLLLFRPVSVAPVWLTWHDSLLVSMAQKMYDNRDFSDMPVLADALEDAGCTNQAILDHCRSAGEHVRGCWVLDALLGRE